MDTAREYSEMMGNKYKRAVITPLLSAWEFMNLPRQSSQEIDLKHLNKMAINRKWSLKIDFSVILKDYKTAIVITDKDQNIDFTSSGFERMTGYNNQEVKGKNPNFLQGVNTDKATSQIIRNAISELKPVSAVIQNYKKDGTPYYCEVNIQPVFNRKNELVNFIAVENAIDL